MSMEWDLLDFVFWGVIVTFVALGVVLCWGESIVINARFRTVPCVRAPVWKGDTDG